MAAAARTLRRMPDFAGVALVDILANGVAMLIIVIVLSIAARMDREERYAEQASEVATVMSHKFSTSLVLNSLAASPPARLHDYENSPLDRFLDPEILPILELHGEFVREFYSGAIWTRRDLLEEHGGLGAWLAGLDAQRKARLRVDVYDIPQFYVTMSILREHGIRIFHWHFLSGALSVREAGALPAGSGREGLRGRRGGHRRAAAPARHRRGANPADSGAGNRPCSSRRRASGTATAARVEWRARRAAVRAPAPGPMPGGVVPGMAGSAGAGFDGRDASSASAQAGSGRRRRGFGGGRLRARRRRRRARSGGDGARSALGSGGRGTTPGIRRRFGHRPGRGRDPRQLPQPRTRAGGDLRPAGAVAGPSAVGKAEAAARRHRGDGAGQGGEGPQINIRIALPETIRRAAQSGSEGLPALEALFGVILHYLAELQGTLDSGGTPSPQIDSFAERIQRAFRTPPDITDAARQVARDLALKFALLPHLGTSDFRADPLALGTAPRGAHADTTLVVTPNRLNDTVGIDSGAAHPRDETAGGEDVGGGLGDGALRDHGRVHLALNAYPGIWKGLEIELEPYSVVLMPPEAREPERMRWRAAAYITPRLDDFIVGFVFAGMDADGSLRIQADANRARLDGRPLFTEYRESTFGSRGWLVTLYAALAAGLLLVAASWRYLSGRAA